jgi:hypothetical protein
MTGIMGNNLFFRSFPFSFFIEDGAWSRCRVDHLRLSSFRSLQWPVPQASKGHAFPLLGD